MLIVILSRIACLTSIFGIVVLNIAIAIIFVQLTSIDIVIIVGTIIFSALVVIFPLCVVIIS